MRKVAVVALTAPLLLAGASLIAQTMPMQAPGKADPARVTGGTYKVEPAHTQVAFDYLHMGFTQNMGLIAQPTSGSLTLNPKLPAKAKVSVEFPVANLRTGIDALDEHLAKPEFFDAAKFPTARFESTAITVRGTKADITGNLTIKGVTKPVTLHATFIGAGTNPMSKAETVGFSATALIKRSDFNMGYGVPMVGDAINLRITAAFEKQG